jgi:hypothetical protein
VDRVRGEWGEMLVRGGDTDRQDGGMMETKPVISAWMHGLMLTLHRRSISMVPRHRVQTAKKMRSPRGTPVLLKAPGMASTPAPKRPLKKMRIAMRVLVFSCGGPEADTSVVLCERWRSCR